MKKRIMVNFGGGVVLDGVVLPVLGPSTLRDTAGSFANVMGETQHNASVHGNNEFLSEGLYIG